MLLSAFLVLLSVFVRWKATINGSVRVTDPVFGMRLPYCSKLAINWKKKTITSQFPKLTSSSKFFGVALFFFPILVNGPSFMSISSMVLELWQILFIRDWPEICKSKLPSTEFYSISGDQEELKIQSLARLFLAKTYWILKIGLQLLTFLLSY